MVRRDSRLGVGGCAVALALILPAVAQAVAPVVNTAGVTRLTDQSARLTGSVNPGGEPTTYQFEYGTSTAYGTVTATATVNGTRKAPVGADLTGLTPGKVYHYRLIAQNASGAAQGLDRKFKTLTTPPAPGGGPPPPSGGGGTGASPPPQPIQPLGVTFAGTPNPMRFGVATTLAGQLTGTDRAGRPVVLQSNPWPFTQGFKDVGSPLVTDATGTFAFHGIQVPFDTQYRVALPDRPGVVSPFVLVSVQMRVGTRMRSVIVMHKGRRLSFSGSIRPAVDGARIAVQKKRGSRWMTVARTIARRHDRASSAYSTRLRISRGGRYRVLARVANGSFVPSAGREIVVRTR
jgi:hypothetical protein